MSELSKERDTAFVDFVQTGSLKKVRAYCKKNGVPIPEDKKVMKAGIYKAIQECADIPQSIKDEAFRRCLELGFSPLINFGGGDDDMSC